MHCVDVIRELAAPSGRPAPTALLAEHLARCPDCAAWADRAGRLDRLWEATRPEVPSAEAAWTRLAGALDPSSVPDPIPVPTAPRPWLRAARIGFGLAQAAAILVAAFLLSRPEPAAPVASAARIEISQGEPVFIHEDGRVEAVASNENPNAVDPYYTMLGAVEAMAPIQ